MKRMTSIVAFTTIATLIGSLVVAAVGAYIVGHLGSIPSATWAFFRVALLPSLLMVSVAVAGFPESTELRPRRTALIVAFLSVFLAGSVGMSLLHAWNFGLESVNVAGYLVWAPIYALVILPASYPLAFYVLRSSS